MIRWSSTIACLRPGGHLYATCTRSLVSSLLCAPLRRHSNRVRPGTLSCLSARPPDLAFWTGTRPGPGWWACPRALSHFYYTPSARRRRDPRVCVSVLWTRLNVLWPLALRSRHSDSRVPTLRCVYGRQHSSSWSLLVVFTKY
jgi:hypothetical protein